MLLLFPNLFEFWVVFVAFARHWQPDLLATWRRLAIVAGVPLALKVSQEYVIHQACWLDSFTAVEAAQAIWRAMSGPFR